MKIGNAVADHVAWPVEREQWRYRLLLGIVEVRGTGLAVSTFPIESPDLGREARNFLGFVRKHTMERTARQALKS